MSGEVKDCLCACTICGAHGPDAHPCIAEVNNEPYDPNKIYCGDPKMIGGMR